MEFLTVIKGKKHG